MTGGVGSVMQNAHYPSTITTQMDNHKVPINICIDLSKAFDTLNHTILLDNLLHYGIGGTALNLFKRHLTNRTQLTE